MMASEDHDGEEGDYQSVEATPPQDMVQYRVRYAGNAKEEDINKKRGPAPGRAGANPGRLKRVVSCKRKTHHLTVSWRKSPAAGRSVDGVNKENKLVPMEDMEQVIFCMDPLEVPPNGHVSCRAEMDNLRNLDHVTEMSKDHNTMTEVLFSRNLRLGVAMTLWRRNVGELLAYFLRTRDTGVFVDFLPVITKSIDEEKSPEISIGWCVDLLPLVREVLACPYEEYLIVGLRWMESVLKNWGAELASNDGSQTVNHPHDRNVRVFKQQLLELWNHEPYLRLIPGPAGNIAAAVDTHLSHLL